MSFSLHVLYEKGNAIKENGIQLMTSLFSDGSSAVLGIETLRPVALRPDLSTGLPFTLCVDDNTLLWEINQHKNMRYGSQIAGIMSVQMRDILVTDCGNGVVECQYERYKIAQQ
jgi:hypothetical protein